MNQKESHHKEPSNEELIREIREQFAKLTVKDFLSQTLITLSTLAYQKMGTPATNNAYKDLDQAKLAIDAYSNLFKTLSAHLKPEETNTFQETLSKLQIDYVSKKAQEQT